MKKWLSFLGPLAVGLGIAAAVIFANGVTDAKDTKDALRIICDGFFVGGALLLMYGGLRWCYNGGVTDGLGYSAKLLINRIRPHYEEHRESFGEYREKRQAKARSPLPLVLPGALILAVAVILYIAYSSI